MDSAFWKYVDSFGSVEDFVEKSWNNRAIEKEATRLLLEEIPAAASWKDFDDGDPLIFNLMIDLAWTGRWSPKPMRYDPQDVVIHSAEELEHILYQIPKRGYITVVYDAVDPGGFNRAEPDNVLIRHLLNCGCIWAEDEERWWPNLNGAAIVIIRGREVDIYPFPRNWAEIAEFVMHEVSRMEVADLTEKQLVSQLEDLIELLGWVKVNEELQKLKMG